MIVDDPAVRDEVGAAFAGYEKALMTNDIATLDAFFWRSELALRFGVGESLFGHEAIAAFRSARGGSPQRRLRNTKITSFGQDYAVATTEFNRADDARLGRQSQVWVRFPELGWRIVSAHVSLAAAETS